MKKICIAALLLACFLLAALQVFAHPGGTNEDGGHYVGGTSEYHYHHGYPAHDHYDMDGDGDKDCPYDFDDKTGRNSGNSTTSSYSSSYTTPAKPTPSPTVKPTTPAAPESPDSAPVWPFVMSGFFFLVMIGLVIANNATQKTIERQENENREEVEYLRKTYQESLDRIEKEHAETLRKTKEFYMSLVKQKKASEEELACSRKELAIAGKKLSEIQTQIHRGKQEIYRLQLLRRRLEAAPEDVLLPENGLPIWWKKDGDRPYGDYTVYVSQGTKIFHTDKYCASFLSTRTHVFQAISYARPCKKCAENFFDFKEVPEWYAPQDIDQPKD